MFSFTRYRTSPMRYIILLIFVMIINSAKAFVEVNGCHFLYRNQPWRPVGVNLTQEQCSESVFDTLASFGWNSICVSPTTPKQLKRFVKYAKDKKLKICVVLTKEFPIEAIKQFRNSSQIWAWNVIDIEQAKSVRALSPNHLITISLPPNLEFLDLAITTSNIDFISIELTPYELGWVHSTSLYLGLRNCYMKSSKLLQHVSQRMAVVQKPIVISKCSYPRDKMFRLPESSTSLRDSYFDFIINFTFPNSNMQLGGFFFNKWEELPREEEEVLKTPMSMYYTDSLTQQVLFKRNRLNGK